MLRACELTLKGNWDDHLPLIEFAYNNNYQSSIKMAQFEAYMEENVRHQFGGITWKLRDTLDLTWCKKLHRRLK